MDINTLKILGMLVVFAAILIAAFLVVTDKPSWGWFLLLAVLMTGAIFP